MKYVEETYDEIACKSYGYNKGVHDSLHEWDVIRKLYLNNYIKSKDTLVKIPKKIHQIWLGGTLPDKYKGYTESWQKFHPDWEYRLWTDKDIKDIEITRRDIFDYAVNFGMKSDILRYEILRQHGGLYVDTDFECIKPFDDLLYLEYFTGISYDTRLQLYTGLIACIPNHPIMNSVVNIRSKYNGHKSSDILNVTGANYVTKIFNEIVNAKTKGVVAFPPEFFYPFPNNIGNIDPYPYVKSYSYALHHWAIAWVKKKIKYGLASGR